MKDCKDCPSYIEDEQQVVDRFARRIGVPMCGRFGHVLGSPQYDESHSREIRRFRAKDCERFGEPLPETPVQILPYVAVPADDVSNSGESVATCQGCVNLVKQDAVFSETGFPLSLCKAFGKLVFSPIKEAYGCGFADPGMPADSMVGVELLPQFKSGFTVASGTQVEDIHSIGGTGVHDPRLYPTDKEVTPEDDERGIRAWRKVSDPEGHGPDVFLPIWKKEVFSDQERAFIPQLGDKEHPELYVDYSGLLYQFAVDAWELDETLCLVGAPGLGKTEFGRWIAFLMQVPFHRYTFHKASDVDDMVGKIKFDTSRGTYWTDGRITKMYAKLGIGMLDELNLAPEECKEILRSMMDKSSQLVLDQDEGIAVDRHPDGRLLISINPPWDPRNLGAEEFADAEANRMSFSYVGWPPVEVEKHIIKTNCALIDYDIPDELVVKLINIGHDIREASEQGTFPGSWGIRQQIKVARKTKFYSLPRAFKQAALNYYDPQVTQELMSIISTN